jgi:hypothetical protein
MVTAQQRARNLLPRESDADDNRHRSPCLSRHVHGLLRRARRPPYLAPDEAAARSLAIRSLAWTEGRRRHAAHPPGRRDYIGFVSATSVYATASFETVRVARFSDGSSDEDRRRAAGKTDALRSVDHSQPGGQPIVDLTIDVAWAITGLGLGRIGRPTMSTQPPAARTGGADLHRRGISTRTRPAIGCLPPSRRPAALFHRPELVREGSTTLQQPGNRLDVTRYACARPSLAIDPIVQRIVNDGVSGAPARRRRLGSLGAAQLRRRGDALE